MMSLLLLAARRGGLVDFKPASAIWVLIIFVALVLVLRKYAWKNVLAGLTAREERIRSAIPTRRRPRQGRSHLEGIQHAVADRRGAGARPVEPGHG